MQSGDTFGSESPITKKMESTQEDMVRFGRVPALDEHPPMTPRRPLADVLAVTDTSEHPRGTTMKGDDDGD